MIPAWVDLYRGKPWERGSDGPESYDCYGLVRAVLRDRWGLTTPNLDGAWHLAAADALEAALQRDDSPWVRWDGAPAPGDVVAFVGPPGHDLHVGIVVAPGWMLSARRDDGVRTDRYDRGAWGAMRSGPAWRHRDMRPEQA